MTEEIMKNVLADRRRTLERIQGMLDMDITTLLESLGKPRLLIPAPRLKPGLSRLQRKRHKRKFIGGWDYVKYVGD